MTATPEVGGGPPDLFEGRLSQYESVRGIEEHVSSTRLRSLILSKEKELHDINQFRIDTLEQMLRDRDRIIGEMGDKMKKMKEDFQYNLRLIEDRDAELDRYDATFGELKESLRDKDKEISELKITISEIEAKKKREASRMADAEASYQAKLRDVRDEMDMMRLTHEEAMRRAREEVEAVKLDLERQLRETESDMEAQRREITMGFDEVIRQRELETKRREDEIITQLRQMEREAGLKSRALEKVQSQDKTIHEQSSRISALLAENQELQAQVLGLTTEHDEKMNELLETLHAVEKAFVLQKAEYEQERARVDHKHDGALRAAIEKRDAKIDSLKTEERLAQAECQLRELRRDTEDKVASKMREIDAQEAHFSAELERKESATLELKTRLWNTEAELKQLKFKLGDVCKLAEDRGREMMRLREQVQGQRERAEAAGKEVVDKAEGLRREFEAREDKIKMAHEETLALTTEQLEAMRSERDDLRRRVLDLEAELTRRQDKVYELQQEVNAHLQQQQQQAASMWVRPQQQGGVMSSSERGVSPLFSEDMGPASPLADKMSGGGSRRGVVGSSSAWSPRSPGYHHQAPPAVVEENERLRAVISDMRREMDQLREISRQQQQQQQQQPRGGLGASPSSGGARRSSPPRKSAVETDASAAEAAARQRAEEVMKENKRLAEDNQRLRGNCDKLMSISNELKARLQKLTDWQSSAGDPSPPQHHHPVRGSAAESSSTSAMPALPPPPPSTSSTHPPLLPGGKMGHEAPPPSSSRRKDPYLSLETRAATGGGGGGAGVRPTSSSSAAKSSRRANPPPPEPDSEARQRLEQVRDELLLAGTAAPSTATGDGVVVHIPSSSSMPARASDRQTKGQKKVHSRLKEGGQKQSRLDLLSERKKIRNYAIADDGPS